MQYFPADELTTGEIPETTAQLFLPSHMFIFSSPEFGGWSNEKSRNPLYTIIYTMFSHMGTMFTCALSYNHYGRMMMMNVNIEKGTSIYICGGEV